MLRSRTHTSILRPQCLYVLAQCGLGPCLGDPLSKLAETPSTSANGGVPSAATHSKGDEQGGQLRRANEGKLR
jgi:hypothetical protein